MNIIKTLKTIFAVMLIGILIVFTSCSNEMYIYYSKNENYVEATGKISFINYNDNATELYIAFDELSYSFNDNCFKISGKNLDVVKKNNFESHIKNGIIVNFISAPKYFGDGYVMPIVSITIDGICYLEFNEGVNNLLQFLENQS